MSCTHLLVHYMFDKKLESSISQSLITDILVFRSSLLVLVILKSDLASIFAMCLFRSEFSLYRAWARSRYFLIMLL